MRRSEIREYAFMFLYEIEIQTDLIEEQEKLFLEQYPIPADQLDFFKQRVSGVCAKKEELDQRFEPFLVNWTLQRIPKIDLTIIRLALFELLYADDIPDNVAISEAVRLARRYSDEESRSYINAILGNVYRQIQDSDRTEQQTES